MKGLRLPIAALTLSIAGYWGIVEREGYTDTAVIPTKGDVPTIGLGSTEGVKLGDTITPVRAIDRSIHEIDTKYQRAVKTCITAPLVQEEFDGYVELAYNIGAANFCSSTIVKEVNFGRYASGCQHILDWKKAAGYDCSTLIDGVPNKRCYGLWKDRLRLRNKCMEAQ